MTRTEFDRALTEANQENLLTKSRADLVGAINSNDVRESEIRWLHFACHFNRTDRSLSVFFLYQS